LSFLRRKRFWAAILAVLLSIYLFRDFDFESVWNIIKSINFWYLIPLSILEFFIAFVRSQRWKYIIDPGKKIGTLNIFSTFSIGMMMNLLMPALTGQVARVFLLSKKEEIKKTTAFSSIVLEVLFDALVLVILLMIVSLFYAFPAYVRSWEIIGGIIVLVVSIALYRMSRFHRKATLFMAMRKFKPAQDFAGRMNDIRNSFISGLAMLRSSRHLFYVAGLTFLSWTLQAMMVYFLIAAFGLGITLWGAMVIMVINTVMVMIVVTPVNIGTFQLACVFALSMFDVDKQTALSFSILLHFFNYLPPLLLGWYFSFHEGLSFKKLLSQKQKTDDDNFPDEIQVSQTAPK
jgi:uncharacterized protein (TIRG00374 family)